MTAVLSPHPHLPTWSGMNLRSPVPAWSASMASPYQTHNPVTIAEYQAPAVTSTMTVQPPQTPVANSQSGHSRRPSMSYGAMQPDGPWTAEMDGILMDAQARGLRWEQISQYYFPHKSANACRKRFGRAKEERRASDWDEHRIQRVVAAYNQTGMRERMWSMVTRETGEKWQDIERWCFSQGLTKITRSRTGNSRPRSRSSRLSASQAVDDTQYQSSSNDEYEAAEEHVVGLGVSGNHAYHTGPVGPAPISAAPRLEAMLHPNHRYTYTS